MKRKEIEAPAKINLGLQVLNKRPDGYHEINTILHTIGLSDEIEMEISDNISLITIPSLGIAENDNLVFKAAKLLKERYKIKSGVQIILKKNIPMGAGLGGGSSDAASALLGLAKLWQIEKNYDELHDLAAMLGSDVPFFLKKGTALASGRGGQLEYFDFVLPYWILLVNPGIHVSTAKAYQSLKRGSGSGLPIDYKSALTGLAGNPGGNREYSIRQILTNDFEGPVFARHQELAGIKKSLYDCGAVLALMSGSGSSVFGLFGSLESAAEAAGNFSDYFTYIGSPQQENLNK